MLAAGPDPPEVLDVLLGGQAWSPRIAPVSLVSGSGSRQPLPWINTDQLDVVFSKEVEVDIDSLTLVGVNTGQYFPSGFSYDSGSLTATWTFTSPFHVDKLLLNLAGEATDSSPIDDQLGASGQLLFGGRDFQLRFDVLSGDATWDRATTVTDLGNIGLRVGTVIGPPASEFYEHEFDANSDGAITVTDLANVGLRVGTVLPGGDPVPPGPPLIVVALVNDTGLDNSDGVTQDPHVMGTVTDGDNVTGFRVGLDGTPEGSFVDVTGQLQPGGSFGMGSTLDT